MIGKCHCAIAHSRVRAVCGFSSTFDQKLHLNFISQNSFQPQALMTRDLLVYRLNARGKELGGNSLSCGIDKFS